jgi:hypothetical protein
LKGTSLINNDVDRYVIITELAGTVCNKRIYATLANSSKQKLTLISPDGSRRCTAGRKVACFAPVEVSAFSN